MEQKQQQQQLLLLTSLPPKVKVNCSICNKETYKTRARFIQSLTELTGKFFCSKSCAARNPEKKWNREDISKRKKSEMKYRYDRFFHCCKCGDRCGKWIPKEDVVWHKTKLLNQPRCPDCNTLLKQSPRNSKFKKKLQEQQ